jgi:hypothetical protein
MYIFLTWALFRKLAPLTTPDGIARVLSIHHIHAKDQPRFVEVILDNA